MNSTRDLESCATIIDLEPISGNGMLARKRLQVNFFIAPNITSFNLFYPDIALDVMYPVLYLTQEAGVTPALADEWQQDLGNVLEIIDIIFIAGLCIGLGGFVICVAALLYLRKTSKRATYEQING